MGDWHDYMQAMLTSIDRDLSGIKALIDELAATHVSSGLLCSTTAPGLCGTASGGSYLKSKLREQRG